MFKTLLVSIFILGIGGCVIAIVIANEDKKTIIKDYNKQFQDTPTYYKRYMETSVIYKSKHKK